jgi:hypothetical protein
MRYLGVVSVDRDVFPVARPGRPAIKEALSGKVNRGVIFSAAAR